MRKISWVLSTALVGALLLGCAYSKTCNDGVCTIVENGQTRYEGDPAKIAKIKAQKEAADKAEADLLKQVKAAPRRPANEPVRVALFPAVGMDQELSKMSATYDGMLRKAFGKQKGIQLVDPSATIRTWDAATLKNDGFGGHASHFEKQERMDIACDANGARRIRLTGIPADVAVFVTLAPQTKTGFLKGSGKNGAALAQVNIVEFQTCATGLYEGTPHRGKETGESINNLAVAGIDKKGKTGSGELKFKRDAQKDEPAIERIAAGTVARIQKEIRPNLASLAALSKIETRSPAGAKPKIEIKNASDLKKLFGG